MQRALLVMKMAPENAGEVASAFADHDKTHLPREIGATSRTLFHFNGLYFHLVEAPDELDGSLIERIYEYRTHPIFAECSRRLGPCLSPTTETWSSPYDSQATEFYRWDA